ncbi:MAG: hypothetical protein ACOC35_09835 [Promethearchaeia archaeon]
MFKEKKLLKKAKKVKNYAAEMIFFDTEMCIYILHERYSLNSFTEIFSSNEKFALTSPSIFELYVGLYKLQYGKNQIL